MIFSVISSVLIIISIVCLFGLTPEQVTDDLMKLITPNDTMRDRSRNLRGNKKKHRLYRTLVKMKTALAVHDCLLCVARPLCGGYYPVSAHR